MLVRGIPRPTTGGANAGTGVWMQISLSAASVDISQTLVRASDS
jgi:hypothetical protein